MSSHSVPTSLNDVTWNPNSSISLIVPTSVTKLDHAVMGKLYLSSSGFVYANSPRLVVWLKFLALAAYLPIHTISAACSSIFARELGERSSSHTARKSYTRHVVHLASIAWKATLGLTTTLEKSIEEFALAEIDYNNSSRMNEMNKTRSIRFLSGTYLAKCMHPLFHKSQYPSNLPQINQTIKDLKSTIATVDKACGKAQFIPSNSLLGKIVASVSNHTPYEEWSTQDLSEHSKHLKAELTHHQAIQQIATRCQRYAYQSILFQNDLPTEVHMPVDSGDETPLNCCCCCCFWC